MHTGVVGSAIIALYAYWAGLINPLGMLMCLVSAFIATNVESFIGATVQGKYPWLTNEVCINHVCVCVCSCMYVCVIHGIDELCMYVSICMTM
jgi:uncharacterized membrane protein